MLLTVMLIVAVVLPYELEAVMVWSVAVWSAVGVPLKMQVEESDNPVGKVGEAEQEVTVPE